MSLDRFVNFKDIIPTKEQLKMILEDYLGGVGVIDFQEAYWFIVLPGKPSFPFRRIVDWRTHEYHDERWFEVFVGSLTEKSPNIDVITRQADEFTNNVASGFAKLIARYCKTEVDEG